MRYVLHDKGRHRIETGLPILRAYSVYACRFVCTAPAYGLAHVRVRLRTGLRACGFACVAPAYGLSRVQLIVLIGWQEVSVARLWRHATVAQTRLQLPLQEFIA